MTTPGSIDLPDIKANPDDCNKPFPLTDIQQAYWVGRGTGVALGGVSTHFYTEFDSQNLDIDRMQTAWNKLIQRHPMLRAIVQPDGKQVVLPKVPTYHIDVDDLRKSDDETTQHALQESRDELSHFVAPSDQWPLFRIKVSILSDSKFRLSMSFDALTIDARSRNLFFKEWESLYRDPDAILPEQEVSFRDFVLAEQELKSSRRYKNDEQYWESKLALLPPPPDMPLEKNPATILKSHFTRLAQRVDAEVWQQLKDRTTEHGLRSTIVLLTAFSECLKLWSKSPRMTINLTLFNRIAQDPRLKNVAGDFTSSSLLAIDNEAGTTFVERAQLITRDLYENLEHSSVSGVEVIRKLVKKSGSGFGAIMPVVFTSLLSGSREYEKTTPSDWLGERGYALTQTPQVTLDHQVRERKRDLVFVWDVVESVYPEGLLQDILECYTALLKRLVTDPKIWTDPWLPQLESLLPDKQLALFEQYNKTDKPFDLRLMHELFAEQVKQRGDSAAVVCKERQLTYADLDRYAQKIAKWLRDNGAKPGSLVAIVMEKDWEQVAAVLGVLYSGAAYVPIDPTLPTSRLWYLIEQAEAKLILTQGCIEPHVEWPKKSVRLVVMPSVLDPMPDVHLESTQTIDDLAYVIFTSGSTGEPKGVMIDHKGAVNTLLDINLRFGVGPDDRVLALSSLSFDLSVFDIFGTLAAGGTIIMPTNADSKDPSQWLRIAEFEHVTVWNSVPALVKLLVEYAESQNRQLPSFLRLVMMSGDWIPVDLPQRIRAQLPDIDIYSLGGATEASIWSIFYPIMHVDPDWKSIPYGRPLSNQTFHVLDDDLTPCPTWVPGQLFIGGAGVAKGYWRDKARTESGFIHHPRSGQYLYRTGDLGRFLPDGNIEFLGRVDSQVKIQGFRIELGEIEVALEQHPAIKSAVVAAAQGEKQDDKFLVAYTVPFNDAPASSDLREFLRTLIPEYMVPQFYVALGKLPLSSNGKVDRSALPPVKKETRAEQSASITEESYDQSSSADHGEIASRISTIVSDVISVSSIANKDNLLNLGATSVDMIHIANQLETELGFRPAMDHFYKDPSISGLLKSWGQLQKNRKPATLDASPSDQIIPPLPLFAKITDPDRRRLFKESQPGLRRFESSRGEVTLPSSSVDEDLIRSYSRHRSYRFFLSKPVPIERLSKLLENLRNIELYNHPKYRYGSAGGLYPVQTYVFAKNQRLEGLDEGFYYYNPAQHSLVRLNANVTLDDEAFDVLINRPVFDQAAFAVFFVVQMSAISPMYGDQGFIYSIIEAGEMTQLLEMNAPDHDIGLCQIGKLDFKELPLALGFDRGHVLVHLLLGGLIDHEAVKQHDALSANKAKDDSDEDREQGEI